MRVKIPVVTIRAAPAATGDVIYFTATSPMGPGVFRVGAEGGEPLVTPMGVAIAGDRTVFVVDQNGFAPGRASVLRMADAAITPIAENFRAGHQAGAALTLDDGLLAASALDIDRAQAQVLLIQLDTLDEAVVAKVAGANSGSGGVQRARASNVFAWADFSGQRPIQRPGHVYVISP